MRCWASPAPASSASAALDGPAAASREIYHGISIVVAVVVIASFVIFVAIVANNQ